jgi:membrane-associated phospholipid phosphatase
MKAWTFYVYASFLVISLGVGMSLLGDKAHFLKWLAWNRSPFFDYYFYHVTKLGEAVGFVIIGLMLWLRSWRRMIIIPVLGGVVTLVSYLMKKYFYHERPKLYLERTGWDGPLAVLDYHLLTGHASFPSGHSMAAWALFTLTAALIRKGWVSALCLILATSVSLSRVYLMAHFLRDVVAGAAIGFVLGYLTYYCYDRWLNKSPAATMASGPLE